MRTWLASLCLVLLAVCLTQACKENPTLREVRCSIWASRWRVARRLSRRFPGTRRSLSSAPDFAVATSTYPFYPGGTDRQRWHRELLRRAMEGEGFAVYEYEWWHFDFHEWAEYPILDRSFDSLEDAE